MKQGNAQRPNWGKRNILLEAIAMLGAKATRHAIDELVWNDFTDVGLPQRSIGKTLANMVEDGILSYERGLYAVLQTEGLQRRENGGSVAATIAEGGQVILTTEQRNRPGYAITLYSEPTTVENVIQVKIKPEHGGWVKLPIFGNVRICLGPGEVDWGAERISNRGICAIQLVTKNGSMQEITVNPAHTITIAGEE